MSNTTAKNDGVNRAKLYQLALFPLNNGATNVYFVLILNFVAQFGSNILQLGLYASVMVTVMRVFVAPSESSWARTRAATTGRSPESMRTAPSSVPATSIAVRTPCSMS